MAKCEMTISKKFTLNTQNFSSVSPTLIIKIDDIVDVKDLIKVHKYLDILADGLFHKQIESDAKTMAVIKKLGFAKYFKKVEEEGNIDETIELALTKLTELPPF